MRIFFIIFLTSLSLVVHAQGSPEYARLVKIADSLFEHKEYRESASTYMKAFDANKDMAQVKHRYFAACAWAEADAADSAFIQLNRITTKGKYYNYPQISKDSHFQKLYSDKRWEPLLAAVQANMKEEQERLNKTVPVRQ